ncbi:LAME_0A05468g1_1 [Lachancea meyersii CBS 8951]|uniref:LAME_0A05468g1_1 n=1 Tax=Lachancea meyersii CBS 8951 TaxID=1266667 RepID=A0A1G4IQE5_9SACH|nr:LAME_0A05468g1_1 [Lachancea meyersii CBS 8951]
MQKPFKGLTFCPTALPEEVSRNVSRKITKLGGGYSRDLTKAVNVLVVGSVATNKYRFAVQHRSDIVFLDAGVVDTIYDLWLTGDDITMDSHSNYSHIQSGKDRMLQVLQTRYQLGPLKDFVVFVGRVNDTRGNQLSIDALDILCTQQGVHSCNTRHFVKETHWSRPTVFVTDHPHGARVDAARLQGLPVVHPKWILDCHRRNALLDFAFYLLEKNVSTDYEAIGDGACLCWHEVLLRNNSAQGPPVDETLEPRQSQRVVLDKFASHGNRLWNSVMHKANKTSPAQEVQLATTAVSKQEEVPKMLKNEHFFLFQLASKQRAILEKIIVQNGGLCHDFHPEIAVPERSFLVVPSNMFIPQLESLCQPFAHTVTEFFFERCLHYKKLLNPDAWCSPFFSGFRIKASQGLHSHGSEPRTVNVAITGFQGVELLHITKMMESLAPSGLKLRETLNKETGILIINLGALNSIPATHPLWENQFASMFKENRNVEQSQIHRNSMKRKIEFIKQRHSIPVVTAAFIVEIFRRASKSRELDNGVVRIHLNDVNWCISCPKGGRDHLYLEIQNEAPELPPKDIPALLRNNVLDKLNSTSHSPARRNRKEIIARFKSVTAAPSTPQIFTKRSYTDPKGLSTALNEMSLPKIPKLNPTEPLQTIQRSSSWGRMLSDQAQKADDYHETNSSVSETEEEATAHTQVTYGSPQQKTNSHIVSRRLTRQHMREIDA